MTRGLHSSLPAGARPTLLAACGADSPSSRPPPASAPRNLLLVTIDTLRADHLGLHGYPRGTSPALDAFATTAMVFERASATSSWTLPSVASMLTALHPSTHGVVAAKSALAASAETLAERLAVQGFHTGAVTSHVFLGRQYGFDQGFAEYDDELVRATLRESHKAVTSPAISAKGVAWLEARAAEAEPRRWFLWLHYFDPHAEYAVHADVTPRFGTEGIDRYDGEIAFTDASVGSVLARLESLGFADDTVVVVVADHGEEFGEHGHLGHHRTLYEEVLHVPLVVRAPGLPPGRCAVPVSGVDVAPTVCELLGLDPPEASQGQSLVAALRGEPFARAAVVAEFGGPADRGACSALLDGRWKLVQRRRDGSSALYDRERDPGDETDLAGAEPAVVERLKAELARRLEQYARAGIAAPSELELTPQELETLDALGYGGEDAR